ncbi:ABC transporter permease [Thermodesulfovibrio yellowstonii]|uniref:Transport permease protein n=2 Tax=Thermodesulfovibrio yellowstonii TaxID=28262 RepID=B5YGJ0_THEYD|nr:MULTISPECIES: ABC transporter permease [Thermodesulfovibrio]ACI21031.1 ABC-2 type transporter superfamily [Thermodesulfovibrio yellowstonii DSM 11347]ACI22100.1 ABC-2 type transporter superfamily [Thermodesulfovibrio yellowstonii DSM 11347]GLI53016.1 transport permease protein [Thermodesulfovibrio islandicus]
MINWYPVFLKEMLQFKRKLLRLGYIFSAMMSPIIYLVTFGLGLGRTVRLSEGIDYLTFLLPGLVAMSSMNNSYSWVASSLNLSRLYFKTFQVYIQSPIKPSSIMIGEVMAGMVKGLFASLLIIAVGFVVPSSFAITLIFVITLLLNCFMFASLGVITGMITKSHEDTATYSNFFIMPMAFFSGTFFSIDRIPMIFKPIIYVMPLTHTNILIRKNFLDMEAIVSLFVIVFYCFCFFLIGSILMKKYNE